MNADRNKADGYRQKERRMKKKQIIGIVVAAVMFIITCAASMLTNGLVDRIFGNVSSEILTGGIEFSAPAEDYTGADSSGIV